MNKRISFVLALFSCLLLVRCGTNTTPNNKETKTTEVSKTTKPRTATYTFDGVTKSGICLSTPSPYCKGSTVVIIKPHGEIKSFSIENMPQASSGTTQLNDYMPSLRGCKEYAIYTDVNSNPVQFGSQTGTVTKLSANSFTFTATLYDHETKQTKTISGSGAY
ncbi:MAG: hypothetical protein ACK55K_06190 [Bacteroidota bacterium]|jgi:hypothetical protein